MANSLNPQNLSHNLNRQAEFSAHKPALTFGEASWTYQEFTKDSHKLAAILSARGVSKGDRIAYLGFHGPEVLLLLFAATHIGAIFVPLNFRLSSAELLPIIDDCDPSVIVTDTEHSAVIQALKSKLVCQHYFQTNSATTHEDSLKELIAQQVHQAARPVDVRDDDIAAIIYTSGTTGVPKGVTLSHKNLWANNLNWILAAGISANDTVLVTAPPFHVSGLFVLVTTILMTGGHVVLHRGFDTENAIKAIETHAVTVTFMVPSMILMVSQHSAFSAADLSSLRLFVVGGAPTPEPILALCAKRGIPVSHCYGMSECSSAVSFLDPALASDKINSVGLAMHLSAIKLIDEKGNDILDANIKGEICVRGDNVTQGYWNKSDENKAVFIGEGWCRSGDVGYCDEEGYLYLCDRIKDMIISGGENIYPAEIESVLMAHPAVANIAVVGKADEYWGERVVAVVILAAGETLSLDELRAYCDQRLARYKIPKELIVTTEFPMSGAGKVLKKLIRENIQ